MRTFSGLSVIFRFLCFGLLISVSSAWAVEPEIIDVHDSLQGFPYSGGPVEFSQAFQCNKPLSFFTKTGQCKIHCEFGLCEQQCGWEDIVETDFQPEECSDEQVMIYSSLGNSITATASDYRAASNSIALTILKSASIFYEHIEKIQIESVLFGIHKGLIENGKLRPVQLTTLVLSLFPDRNKPDSSTLQLHLDLSQAGLNQVMCLSENGACEPNQHYLIKRKGLVNASF